MPHRFWIAIALGVLAVAQSTFAQLEPKPRPKLGEIHFSPLVGGAAAPQGKRFTHDFLAEGATLLGVRVCTVGQGFEVVSALEFRYRKPDGAEARQKIGDAGTCRAEHAVPEGARLAGISGAGGWFIDQLRFHFTDGSETPTYGGSGGDHEFSVQLRRKEGRYLGRVSGFWGSTDGSLETLGLLYWPEE